MGSVAPRQESVAVEVTRTDVPQLAVSQPAASAESEAQSANQLSASVERPTNIKHTPAPASNAQPLFLPAHDPTDNVPDTPSEPDFPPTFSVAIFPHPRPPHSVATASTIQPSYHPTPPPVPEFVQGSSSGVPITIGQPTQPPASLQSLESAIQPDPNFSQPESTKGRRKRKQSVTEGEGDGAGPKRARSRASSGTPNPRKRPSPPPYDPDADPGEEIDPTTTTMASLCIDTGQGRVSSKAAEILTNHATWKAKNRERRARMKALMEAKKYGRSEDIDQEPEHGESSTTPNENPPDQTAENEEVNEYNYTKNLATSRFNVQVRIGPNGETIIDEDSLVVDRVEADSTQNYTHVVESDHSKFVNSGSYGKRFRGSRWSAEETEMFYDVGEVLTYLFYSNDLDRLWLSTGKTTSSSHISCLGEIGSPAKINSRSKTRKILPGSIMC